MDNLIQAPELYKRLGEENLIVVDTRFDLKDVGAGRKAYEAGHIPGAIYFDVDKDLSGQKSKHGGRHPLPDVDVFVKRLGDAGISNGSSVVIYDDAATMYASRLWWLLRYVGHDVVQVLDGGFSAWTHAGYPVSSTEGEQPLAPTTFVPNVRRDMLVDVDYVRNNLNNPKVVMIDARAADRFRGENETLDPKAGHIPGAISKPFAENLEGKNFKSPEHLKERFADIPEDKEIIVYCGSGVSANHNLIALEQAGIKGARLYVGSWSDWVSYDENPVETGDGKK